MKELEPLDQSRLAALSIKALNGTMEENDFSALGKLFYNVKHEQFSKYLDVMLPNLNDEALHRLVAGLVNYSAEQVNSPNTFLRKDDIIKGLLLAEAERHGFNVGLTEFGTVALAADGKLKIPTAIPDVTRDHFRVALEKHPGVFNNQDGQFNIKNVRTSMSFNLFNSVVLSKLDTLGLARMEIAQNLKRAQKLSKTLEGHVKQIASMVDGEPQLQVGDLNLKPVKQLSESSTAEIAGNAALARLESAATELAEALAIDAQEKLMPKSFASKGYPIEKSGLGAAAPKIIQEIHNDEQMKRGGGYVIHT